MAHLIPYRKGDTFGYCDSSKKVLLAPQWEDADFFSEGLAAVKLNGKWGYIDTTGKVVINYQYCWEMPFYGGEATVDYKCRIFKVIDKNNKVKFRRKYNGECGVYTGKYAKIMYASHEHGNSFALYTNNYKPITSFCYSEIYPTNDERYFVLTKFMSSNHFDVKYGYGVFDVLNKKEIVKCVYESDTSAAFLQQLRLLGIKDIKGFEPNDHLYAKRTVSCNSCNIEYLDTLSGNAAVYNNSAAGSTHYSSLQTTSDRKILIAQLKNKYGLIGYTGKIIIPFENYDIYEEHPGIFMVEKQVEGSKHGYSVMLVDKYGTNYFDN